MKIEIYKDIPNYEGEYQVSNLGNVKSLSRRRFNGKGYYITKEKILKPSVNKKAKRAYKIVRLNNEFKTVHQLVAITFLKHKPKGRDIVVHHIDNNPLNNNVDNLQIITQRQNLSMLKGSSEQAGVCYRKDSKKWRAYINVDGKRFNLGSFKTEDRAVIAYNLALNQLDKFKNII